MRQILFIALSLAWLLPATANERCMYWYEDWGICGSQDPKTCSIVFVPPYSGAPFTVAKCNWSHQVRDGANADDTWDVGHFSWWSWYYKDPAQIPPGMEDFWNPDWHTGELGTHEDIEYKECEIHQTCTVALPDGVTHQDAVDSDYFCELGDDIAYGGPVDGEADPSVPCHMPDPPNSPWIPGPSSPVPEPPDPCHDFCGGDPDCIEMMCGGDPDPDPDDCGCGSPGDPGYDECMSYCDMGDDPCGCMGDPTCEAYCPY